MTTTPSEPRVSRPSPSWSWIYRWRHRGRTDIHGHRQTEVKALFSSNEDRVEGELPNEIVIEHQAGEHRSTATVRMDRNAAEQLIEQLQAALAWDGR